MIPKIFSDIEAAPLLCAGIIGYRAFKRSNPPSDGTLAIFGFGSSAHITIQIAQHRGMKVYVSTRGTTHQELARKLGAVWVGDCYDLPPVKVDSAIIFAPVGDLVPVALRSIKSGGTVSLAGIHMTTIPAMEYEPYLFHEKNLCSVEANTRQDGEDFLREAAQIPVTIETELFSLVQANEALNRLKRGEMHGSGVIVIS